MQLIAGRDLYFRQADFVEAEDTVAGGTDKMYVLVVVFVFVAGRRAECVGGGALQVENFMENSLFFQYGQYAIERHAVDGFAQQALEFRLGNGRFFFRHDLKHAEPRLGYFQLIPTQQVGEPLSPVNAPRGVHNSHWFKYSELLGDKKTRTLFTRPRVKIYSSGCG